MAAGEEAQLTTANRNQIIQARHIRHLMDAVELLTVFLAETSYEHFDIHVDREHLGELTTKIYQRGSIWIAYEGTKPIGLLMAFLEPNMWTPNLVQFRELVWFVLPKYRNTTVGGRLFHYFMEQGQELLAQGQCHGIVTTTMTTTRPVGLERRGFRLMEQTYVKD